jgi:rubredoxin
MTQHLCKFCAHIYDEAVGDPERGVPPGTPIADLPDDWTCPECGASKDDYDPLGD